MTHFSHQPSPRVRTLTRFRWAACVALVAAIVACEPEPKTDPHADSIAAERARFDSVEAIQLVTVDTNLAPSLGVNLSRMEKRPSGLYMLDRRSGSGAVADSGKWILVHYTTSLADGTVIDDTRKSGEARRVLLGYGEVIAAWEEGLRGMRVGGRRLLVAPASLGYGKPGRPGSVPRLATLVFDVELVRVY